MTLNTCFQKKKCKESDESNKKKPVLNVNDLYTNLQENMIHTCNENAGEIPEDKEIILNKEYTILDEKEGGVMTSGRDSAKEKPHKSDMNFEDVSLCSKLVANSETDKAEISHRLCQDLQNICKKLSCSERKFYVFLMSVFATMTFALVFGLFVLQAQMSRNSHEILSHMQRTKTQIPQGVYDLYFDYLETSGNPDKVDLRANTSIFVH